MKQYLEVYLIIALVALLYYKPAFLTGLSNTFLGKLALLIGVMYLAHNHGVSSGILGAAILILLVHNVLEGVDETLAKDDVNEGDEQEEENDDEDEEEVDAELPENTNDQLDNEELIKSDITTGKIDETSEENGEPEGVATDATIEGFALYQ